MCTGIGSNRLHGVLLCADCHTVSWILVAPPLTSHRSTPLPIRCVLEALELLKIRTVTELGRGALIWCGSGVDLVQIYLRPSNHQLLLTLIDVIAWSCMQ